MVHTLPEVPTSLIVLVFIALAGLLTGLLGLVKMHLDAGLRALEKVLDGAGPGQRASLLRALPAVLKEIMSGRIRIVTRVAVRPDDLLRLPGTSEQGRHASLEASATVDRNGAEPRVPEDERELKVPPTGRQPEVR